MEEVGGRWKHAHNKSTDFLYQKCSKTCEKFDTIEKTVIPSPVLEKLEFRTDDFNEKFDSVRNTFHGIFWKFLSSN